MRKDVKVYNLFESIDSYLDLSLNVGDRIRISVGDKHLYTVKTIESSRIVVYRYIRYPEVIWDWIIKKFKGSSTQ